MVDSAYINFIQHFADIYFSKSVCTSECRGVSSKSFLLPSFISNLRLGNKVWPDCVSELAGVHVFGFMLYHNVFSVGNIGVHNRYPVAIQGGVDLQLSLVVLTETGGLFDFSFSLSAKILGLSKKSTPNTFLFDALIKPSFIHQENDIYILLQELNCHKSIWHLCAKAMVNTAIGMKSQLTHSVWLALFKWSDQSMIRKQDIQSLNTIQ